MQKTINSRTSDVAVRDLQLVSKADSVVLKNGEEEKTKRYVALCWSRNPLTEEQIVHLNSVKDLTLKQQTPIRVLHRRPLATRERTVYRLAVLQRVGTDPQSSHFFVLELSTQAGTYIKEFVHGDLGRTRPSLGDLLSTECDILVLDVTAVELDWPKPLDVTT